MSSLQRWFREIAELDEAPPPSFYCGAIDGLQKVYREKLLPIEQSCSFNHFHSAALSDADLAAPPMVLLLGQYSTGKTTFIRHLLGRDYPGLRIGPEPTTDKFVAVTYGETEMVVPGHALAMDVAMPFTQLSELGNGFLSRFEGVRCPNPLLQGMTLIDSPGVLAGDKQRIQRGYDYDAVVRFFAARSDAVLLLFDVSKLDISDEFRSVIQALCGCTQKIHIILNKADRLTTPQLMRVYGALMWSLGKIIDTPEVSRVYVGSFWDEPLANSEQSKLFDSERRDLFQTFAMLPRSTAIQRLDDLVRRARLAKVHAYILDNLRGKMPWVFGKAKAQKKLIAELDAIYDEVARAHNLVRGDFPDVGRMQGALAPCDFSSFPKINRKKMEALDSSLTSELPRLLTVIAEEQRLLEVRATKRAVAPQSAEETSIPGTVESPRGGLSPFECDMEEPCQEDPPAQAQDSPAPEAEPVDSCGKE